MSEKSNRKKLENLLLHLEDLFSDVGFSRAEMSSLHREFQDTKATILKTFNSLDKYKLFKNESYQDLSTFLEDNIHKLDLLKSKISPPKQPRSNQLSGDLNSAYRFLGLSADASDEMLKDRYHEKISKNHPDKVEGIGLDREFSELAKERSQEINKAWKMIKKHRGIK